MQVSSFFVMTDLAVVDVNPEMADMDNPRGEIIGYAAYVYADSERGDRRRLFVKSSRWQGDVVPMAEKLCDALNARLAAGKLPVGFDRWEEARPCYGSDAYVAYGQADDVLVEMFEENA